MHDQSQKSRFPPIIGHRGACGYAPENTLDSIQTALALGVECVEFDVKITKDQVPVLFHDETLERTTNGNGNIRDYSYAELQCLEAGSWFGDSFSGTRIPSLEDALDVILGQNIGINIEIKPCPGRERETTEVVLDALTQIWDDHDKIMISSFTHVALETALELAPDWPRGLLIGHDSPSFWQNEIEQYKIPGNCFEVGEHVQATSLNIYNKLLKREQVENIIDAGYYVMAYTVNNPDEGRHLQAWGVDSIFTDVPDVMQENLFTVHNNCVGNA